MIYYRHLANCNSQLSISLRIIKHVHFLWPECTFLLNNDNSSRNTAPNNQRNFKNLIKKKIKNLKLINETNFITKFLNAPLTMRQLNKSLSYNVRFEDLQSLIHRSILRWHRHFESRDFLCKGYNTMQLKIFNSKRYHSAA